MDPVDFINRRLDRLLPGNHRWLLLGLLGFLLVITHDNDYAGEPLLLRNTQPVLAEISSLENTATAELTENTGILQSLEIPANLPTSEAQPQTSLSQTAIEAGPTPDFVTEVKPGDNLSLIFARAGLSPRDVYEVSRSKPETPILTKLFPGYLLEFSFDDNKELESLRR